MYSKLRLRPESGARAGQSRRRSLASDSEHGPGLANFRLRRDGSDSVSPASLTPVTPATGGWPPARRRRRPGGKGLLYQAAASRRQWGPGAAADYELSPSRGSVRAAGPESPAPRKNAPLEFGDYKSSMGFVIEYAIFLHSIGSCKNLFPSVSETSSRLGSPQAPRCNQSRRAQNAKDIGCAQAPHRAPPHVLDTPQNAW